MCAEQEALKAAFYRPLRWSKLKHLQNSSDRLLEHEFLTTFCTPTHYQMNNVLRLGLGLELGP